MVLICIRVLQIPLEWLGFAFESLESRSNVSILHSNPSNPVRMVQICIPILRIPFEWYEFAFEWIESCSYESNLSSNTSNAIRMDQICIRIHRMPFEWIKFVFECFKSHWSGSNWHSKASKSFDSRSNGSNFLSNGLNRVRVVRICFRMFRIPFDWFEFAFKCF